MGKQRPAGPDKVKFALEAAGQALFEYDHASGRINWTDVKSAMSILGIDKPETISTSPSLLSFLQPEEVMSRENALRDAFENRTSYTIEYRVSTGRHPMRWIEERGSWMKIAGDWRLIGMVRTIDEQKNREARLSYLAAYDEQTGLLNRPRIREMLKDEIDAGSQPTGVSAYLLVGIDRLGGINSDFGFEAADEVIVEISRRLRSKLATQHTIGRVAGTKFGIILRSTCREGIRNTCYALLNVVREKVVETNSGGVAVSVCIGATELEGDVTTAETAMARAEAALDKARQIGPSSWSSFSENTDIVSRRQRNTEMSDVILTALNDRRIYLAYQPIISEPGAPHRKFECLVRMEDPDGEEVPAPAFIPAAERLGLVHLLDRRVLDLATQALRKAPDIKLNVNISWETVKDPVWADGYLAQLRANREVTDRLTIELTETQVMDAVEASVEFIAEIKELGCRFAIDDFGAGYTSFRNLQALDIDVLKIDGSFITGVSSSRENQLFVRTLLDLARNFGMKTVAEWVDNESDALLLKGLGVDYLQGYYIGKPDRYPPAIYGEHADDNGDAAGKTLSA
ncbi:EAL domain-containing protein [Parvularcula flava]|uniref:EAL domain-containing protein n=1 Tax=Aquisalinus luteolus TaxID=1566827 RepID=A0A8J3A2V7_9PROT|nr:GGDEF domain-containing phosphodiesterase [Aquisalinus luteolus]NHK28588.1 EAL domain-containing protein [Aquisalinus luteolus]GGH98928.1 GGDEF-domain containing protein [Aquisalinus luteolus]